MTATTRRSSTAISSSSNNNNKRKRTTAAVNSNTHHNGTATVPMFLRKTYGLIESCDPSIATWADDGLSFIVKDVDKFANESIPRCFKHNKFSSFVRQLNFYGFRKVRDDPVFLNDIDETTSEWCQFHHPNFRKGHPELLSEIKKPSQTEPAEKEEVDALRAEVKSLRAQVKNLRSDMNIMATLLGDVSKQLQLQQQQQQQPLISDPAGFLPTATDEHYLMEPSTKKLRVTPSPSPLAFGSGVGNDHDVLGDSLIKSDQEATIAPPDFSTVKPIPLERYNSNLSTISMSSEDERFLESIFADNNSPEAIPEQIGSI